MVARQAARLDLTDGVGLVSHSRSCQTAPTDPQLTIDTSQDDLAKVAMQLAGRGYQVIAGVEITAQIEAVKRQAIRRGVSLRVEKLDVRRKPTAMKRKAS